MMDGQMVLTQARQGRAAPDWQVLPVRPAHFVRMAVVFGLATIALVALLVSLVLNPNEAFTPATSIDSESALTLWRTMDFVVGAVLLLACLGGAVFAIRDFGARHTQLLVLMPDGFAIQTGANPRLIRAVSYATVGPVSVSIVRGEYFLTMPRLDGRGVTRIQLDGRFGPPKQIVQHITTAQAQYAAMWMRG